MSFFVFCCCCLIVSLQYETLSTALRRQYYVIHLGRLQPLQMDGCDKLPHFISPRCHSRGCGVAALCRVIRRPFAGCGSANVNGKRGNSDFKKKSFEDTIATQRAASLRISSAFWRSAQSVDLLCFLITILIVTSGLPMFPAGNASL